MHIPRIIISSTSGGGGKTLLSLGLIAALRQKQLNIKPYKKGPDYIDAAWLGLAAANPCTNLDLFFLPPQKLCSLLVDSFQTPNWNKATPAAQFAVIEGNRGLYDGYDLQGSYSTAALARTTKTPIILSIDCTKATRTIAAIVAGLHNFEPHTPVAGVVLNKLGSARHEQIITQAITTYTDIPVLGAIPRLVKNPLPERHMGLSSIYAEQQADLNHSPEQDKSMLSCKRTNQDNFHKNLSAKTLLQNQLPDQVQDQLQAQLQDQVQAQLPDQVQAQFPDQLQNQVQDQLPEQLQAQLEYLGQLIAQHVDMEQIIKLGHTAPELTAQNFWDSPRKLAKTPCIGYIHDAALWFYYPENLQALRQAGAKLVALSLLDPKPWPKLDGLYLGGGFPEMLAQPLSISPHLPQLKVLAAQGLPIYAECGGLMVLCHSLQQAEQNFPMSGVFSQIVEFCKKPQGLGYVRAKVTGSNAFFAVGEEILGHEFHYSRLLASPQATHCLKLRNKTDGLSYKNTFAAYTHLFAPANPSWAKNFVDLAAAYPNPH